MREVTLSTGKTVKILPLKGRDVRELAAMQRTEDWTLLFETLQRAGFKQEEMDELPFPDVLAINRAINAETYGVEDEVKN